MAQALDEIEQTITEYLRNKGYTPHQNAYAIEYKMIKSITIADMVVYFCDDHLIITISGLRDRCTIIDYNNPDLFTEIDKVFPREC